MQKISIIIPCYNAEKYIVRCLQSAVEQTLKEIEIIIVNDASTDGSLEIVKKFQKQDNRIKLIDFKDNRGNGIARNIAVKRAKGEFILFLDADDWLEPQTVNIAYQKAMERRFYLVLFGYTKHYFKGDNFKYKEANIPNIEDNSSDYFKYALLNIKGFVPMPWAYLYSRQFLIDNHITFSEGIIFEDIIFTTKANYYGQKIGIIKETLYNYRVHSQSITQSLSKKKIDDSFTAHLSIRDFLEEQQSFKKYEKEFTIRLLTSCVAQCFRDYLMMPKEKKDKELYKFMEQLRTGTLLHYNNISLLRQMYLSLSKEDKGSKMKFKNSYYFLLLLTRKNKLLQLIFIGRSKVST